MPSTPQTNWVGGPIPPIAPRTATSPEQDTVNCEILGDETEYGSLEVFKVYHSKKLQLGLLLNRIFSWQKYEQNSKAVNFTGEEFERDLHSQLLANLTII